MRTTLVILALLGMTLTGMATPAAAWDLVCAPTVREADPVRVDPEPECKSGDPDAKGIPCVPPNPTCVAQINVRVEANLLQVTDEVDGATLQVTEPILAYVGTVALFIGGHKVPAVGVGVNNPCEAYANLVPCEVNPFVPPTALRARSAAMDTQVVDLPNLCLQSAVLSIDANGDGYTEAETPALWLGAC